MGKYRSRRVVGKFIFAADFHATWEDIFLPITKKFGGRGILRGFEFPKTDPSDSS